MAKFGILQAVPDVEDDLDAETIGLTTWLDRLERQGFWPLADPEISIVEPLFYLDESGKRFWANPLVDQDGNDLLDELGEQIPPPRMVRVVGEVERSHGV